MINELRAEAAAHFAQIGDPRAGETSLRATESVPDDVTRYRRDRTWPGFHTPFGPHAVMH